MKTMLNGTDALWRLWLGFFREHFAAIMSVVVLLPLSLYINWQLAILLFILCVVFTVLTTLVVRKTYGMQSEVEEHYNDLSARASDALGNVALVQSFVRIDAEVQGLRFVADKLLAAQMPVLAWWALVTVITRASTTITVLAIFTVGIDLHQQNLTTVGEIVMFVSFATMLIAEARAGRQLHQQRVHGSPSPAAILRRARRRAGGARPSGRDGHRAALGPDRIQRRLVLL